jgi:hypothetical protein
VVTFNEQLWSLSLSGITSDQHGAPARASRLFEPTASKTSFFEPGSVRRG